MATRSWQLSGQVPTLAGPARKDTVPEVDMNIHIDDHYPSKVYTTASSVSGHIEMNTVHDVGISEIRILLLGICKTRVDAVSVPLVTSHAFLKLTMPIPDSCYPTPRRLQAGKTYSIPFHFVIPQHLTLNACSHKVVNESLREHHLRLPPSVGDWDKDDFAPKMSHVSYCVTARAYGEEDVRGEVPIVGEASYEIKVIPVAAEDAPLSVTKHDKMYVMTKSKTLRKSILSPKLGSVTVSANQPAPAMISSDGYGIMPTTAHIDLAFEPTSIESQPPRIVGVTSKITAITYYSSNNLHHYPNLQGLSAPFSSDGRGHYSSSVPLPSVPVKIGQWEQRLTELVRQDSGYDSDLRSDSGRSQNSKHILWLGQTQKSKRTPYYYTAKLQVPVLPPVHKKQFIPTFHSCITSRVYVLGMTVTLSTTAGKVSSVTLAVPLQIGAGPRGEGRDQIDANSLPNVETVMEDAGLGVDAYLQPRTIFVPNIDFRSVLPGCSDSNNQVARRL